MRLKVSVNGFGTIGKRIADAVALHPDMELVGIAKYTPDVDAQVAASNGFRLYTSNRLADAFSAKGLQISGSIEEMVQKSDVVIDASPDGFGGENKKNLYVPNDKRAVFQGGEEPTVADVSFNARSNFEQAAKKRYVRVVSCNTTGFCRIIKPVLERYPVASIMIVLMRRGADPSDAKGAALNAIEWGKAPSHHSDDVKSVITNAPVASVAFKVPHTLMHVSYLFFQFEGKAPSSDDLEGLYRKENRLCVLREAKSTAQIVEAARDFGFKRGDTFTANILWNTFHKSDNQLGFAVTTLQESIVIPENLDAIVAQAGIGDKQRTMETTDKLLNLDEIKRKMEDAFC